MSSTTPIPAPVPPAQPTDLAKMVEELSDEIGVFYCNSPVCRQADAPYLSAILLRHLQPLADELAAVQLRKIEACIAWTEANDKLTAAQEELARVQGDYEQDKQHFRMKFDEVASASRDALDTARKLDDRNGLIHQLRSMLREAGFNDRIKLGEDLDGNEDWQQIRVECQLKDALDKLTALQSAHAKGAEDGKRWAIVNAALESDAEVYLSYVADDIEKMGGKKSAQRLRSIVAGIRSARAKPEASP